MARKLNLSKWVIAVVVVIAVVAIVLGVLGSLGYLTPKPSSSDGKHPIPGSTKREFGGGGGEKSLLA
jgi:hypothetical protein